MGRKEQESAKRTVLQGGFATNQRVVLCDQAEAQASEGAAVGTLGAWLEEEGCWEVELEGGGAACVRADRLRLEAFSGDEAEEEKEPGEAEAQEWRGRQVAPSQQVGDLVEAWHRGAWVDAVIVEPPSDGSVRVVLLAECREATLPAVSFRRKENHCIHKRRLEASAAARAKLLRGVPVTDADVLEVLRLWAFGQNPVRKNVIPDGEQWVYSDTLGLVHSRCSGACAESRLAVVYPDMMRLLGQWVRHSGPKEGGKAFPFTGINLNFAYAAKLHRDRHNAGPSLLRALGDFEGGKLGYFADDDGKLALEDLPREQQAFVDTRASFKLIDGKRAHSVEAFRGERYSVVFFTCGSYKRAPSLLRKALVSAGAEWPTGASMSRFMRLLPRPCGYAPPAAQRANAAAPGRRKREAEEAAAEEGPRHRLRCKTSATAPPPAAAAPAKGTRFKLVGFPHLALGLQLERAYTTGALVRKCGGDLSKLTALRRKLRDPAIFEPLAD